MVSFLEDLLKEGQVKEEFDVFYNLLKLFSRYLRKKHYFLLKPLKVTLKRQEKLPLSLKMRRFDKFF